MTLQPAAVLPADAEMWGTDYVRRFLATRSEPYATGVYVSNKKPTTNRPRTIVVRRDGGPIRGLFDFPRLAFRVWADDEQEAADLARLLIGGLKVAPGDGPVVALLNIFGPSPIPDESQFQRLVNAEMQLRCTNL